MGDNRDFRFADDPEHFFRPGTCIDDPTAPDDRWCDVCGEQLADCHGIKPGPTP